MLRREVEWILYFTVVFNLLMVNKINIIELYLSKSDAKIMKIFMKKKSKKFGGMKKMH